MSTHKLRYDRDETLQLLAHKLLSALSSACDFKSPFCKPCGPRSRSSLIRVHTFLPVCKKMFEKFARIFSRRHKQTTFSDAGFLGILMVNSIPDFVLYL